MGKEKTNLSTECGKRLRAVRDKKNITQEELAALAHYSVQQISGIENGRRKMTVGSAAVFADVLGVREDYLTCKNDFETWTDEASNFYLNIQSKVNDLDNIIKRLGFTAEFKNPDEAPVIALKDIGRNLPMLNPILIITPPSDESIECTSDEWGELKENMLYYIECQLDRFYKKHAST